MAFKGHAQAGNFSSYALNLPITDEINEDLRIAGGKVRDIQLTAQRRQQQAEQYIGALNNKFKIEQQNRDTNNRFMMDNYKAIYEGEQRQFKGEMAELQREAAKPREKSELEKALPAILAVAKLGMSAYASHHQAQVAGAKKTMQATSEGLAEHGKTIGDLNKFNESYEIGLGKGLSEQAALEYASKHNEGFKEWLDKNPNGLGDFRDAKGISIAAYKESAMQGIINKGNEMIVADQTRESSELNKLLGGYGGDYITASREITQYNSNAYVIAAGGGDSEEQIARGKEIIADLRDNPGADKAYTKNLAKLNQSMRKTLADNTKKFNEQQGHADRGQAIEKALRNDGIEAAVTQAREFYRASETGGKQDPVGEATYVTEFLTARNIDPAMIMQAKEAFAKNHHGPLNNTRVGAIFDDAYNESLKRINSNQYQAQRTQAFQGNAVVNKARAAEPEEARLMIQAMRDSGEIDSFNDETRRKLGVIESGSMPKSAEAKIEAHSGAIAKNKHWDTHAKDELIKRIQVVWDDKANQNVNVDGIKLAHSEVMVRAGIEYDKLVEEYPLVAKRNPTRLMDQAVKIAAEQVIPDKNSLSGEGTALKPLVDTISSRPKDLGAGVSTARIQSKEYLKRSSVVTDKNFKDMYVDIPQLEQHITNGITNIESIAANPNGVLNENTVLSAFDSPYLREVFEQEQNKSRIATYGETILRAAKAAGASEGTLGVIKENITTRQEAEAAYNWGARIKHNAYTSQEARQLVQGGPIGNSAFVRQPVEAIVGSDVKSQGVNEWRDGKHEDHNHYGFESTAHRDQAAAWVKAEYKRRWGNEYLLNRDELEINHHEDRQGPSLHGEQGGRRGSDIPRHNFVHGVGETIGANRVHQLYSEWFRGLDKQTQQPQQQSRDVSADNVLALEKARQMSGETTAEEFNQTREAIEGADDVRITKGGIKFWFTNDGKLNMMTPDGKTKREALGEISIDMLEVLEADEVVNNKGGLW